MRSRCRRLATAALFTIAVTGYGLVAPAIASAAPSSTVSAGSVDWADTREVFSPDGTITRVPVKDPTAVPPATSKTVLRDVPATGRETILESAPILHALDLVIMGDGYTANQIGTFRTQARAMWNYLKTIEPYASLQDKFNVWQLNVISNQSGTDHDPQGSLKDTALNGRLWCNGIERLPCVDGGLVDEYAQFAPAADQVIVLINTATFCGGAGGGGPEIPNPAMVCAGNANARTTVVHELGHSIGGLGDEYETPPGGAYTGGEPDGVNVTIATEAQLRSLHFKWYSELGNDTPDGGVIGVYQGALGKTTGVYRASQNSAMRTLGQPYNLVSLRRLSMMINYHDLP